MGPVWREELSHEAVAGKELCMQLFWDKLPGCAPIDLDCRFGFYFEKAGKRLVVAELIALPLEQAPSNGIRLTISIFNPPQCGAF